MLDTHCHLTYPQLSSQLDAVLERAAAAGVSRMITIGTDLADSRTAVELCATRPNVRCTVGVHPNHADAADASQIQMLPHDDPSVVAIGETGLDYHYDRVPVDRQKAMFVAQLELAKRVGKPVVIHCREAVDNTLATLRNFPDVPAVFHCFTGTLDEARRILDAGYLLGFTGPVTFKKNDELREVVRLAPAYRILVETDAPYLSPEPMRKRKVNEPSFVIHTAEMVGRVRGMSLEQIDRVTTENARRFFRWE